MKTFIKEFVEKAINETGSFLMHNERRYVSFFQDSVGEARYIFFRRDYKQGDSCIGLAKLDLIPKLVAIVANGLVYIVDSYFFDTDPDLDDVPRMSNMVYFREICRNANEQIADEIFPRLFEQLPVDVIKGEEKLDEACKIYARRILLGNMDMPSYDESDIRLSDNQIAQILCGFSTVLETSMDLFRENESKYRKRKTLLYKIKELMQSPDIVETWERRMAEELKSTDAKTVTVYFTVNGKTESTKIEPEKILYKLATYTCFYVYNFVTQKSARQLFERLGVSSLVCQNITKITYGKEVLFER